MIFILGILAGWPFHIVDIQVAFLHREFEDGKVIYMKIPQGFEQYCDPKEYLLLMCVHCMD
jgi:hypothetical protein